MRTDRAFLSSSQLRALEHQHREREQLIEGLAYTERQKATWVDLIDAIDSEIKREGRPFEAELENEIRKDPPDLAKASRELAVTLLAEATAYTGGRELTGLARDMLLDYMQYRIESFALDKTAHTAGRLFQSALQRQCRRIAEGRVE